MARWAGGEARTAVTPRAEPRVAQLPPTFPKGTFSGMFARCALMITRGYPCPNDSPRPTFSGKLPPCHPIRVRRSVEHLAPRQRATPSLSWRSGGSRVSDGVDFGLSPIQTVRMKAGPRWPLDRIKTLAGAGQFFVQRTRVLDFFPSLVEARKEVQRVLLRTNYRMVFLTPALPRM